MNLEELRRKIDALDEQIIKLLNERISVALKIGEEKKAAGAEVYVPSREREVFKRIEKLNRGPLPKDSAKAIYREIMSAALALESNLKVAYLGPPATFTHMAARAKFGASVDYLSAGAITDIFNMVQNGSADYGVVPIENSTEGAVTHTFDRFISTPLKICAEIYQPVTHHLMSNSSWEEITKIYSHTQVFGQCRHWLNEHMPGIEQVPVGSTAKAAAQAAQEEGAAAIASTLAADLYGLNVLSDNIQDVHGNTTRFLFIAPTFGPPTGNDKTSIVFGVKHKVGALYEALSVFKADKINMTKIESRPNRSKVWEYYFFVDIDGHVEDEVVKRALDELQEYCTTMTVLGSYPKADM